MGEVVEERRENVKITEEKQSTSLSNSNDSDQEYSSEEETETEDFKNLESVFTERNLILKIKSTSLHVNSEQIIRESPVFERMLQSEFQEKDVKEIILPGKRVEDFVHFLRCTLPSIDDCLEGSQQYYSITHNLVKTFKMYCSLCVPISNIYYKLLFWYSIYILV